MRRRASILCRIRNVATGGKDDRVLASKSFALPVVFYLSEERDVARLRDLDPDRDLDAFRPGEFSWVAQTYLRLRAAGHPVELTATLPERALVVFHAKHKHALARAARAAGATGDRRELYFVAIRADNSSPLLADFEVLQSGRFADGRTRFWIPFWPQPGLLPRDAARGTTLARVAYMGLIENLHPDFRGEAWRSAVAAMGLDWVVQEVRFRRDGDLGRIDWEDYRSLDAVVAVRPRDRHLRYSKPASKLINAWRAGVPALLGPEFAYREIRRSAEEFLEVASATEALAALGRLRDEPGLYARMVAAGRERAPELSFEALTQRWAELVFATIPERIASGALPWSHRLALPVRIPLRRCLRLLRAERSR
ncbi:MAG: hypothetical protein QG573_1775 [Acidobacteriota bacterium]|nr:hypothetical protein [Acidobacteriota bacterium]